MAFPAPWVVTFGFLHDTNSTHPHHLLHVYESSVLSVCESPSPNISPPSLCHSSPHYYIHHPLSKPNLGHHHPTTNSIVLHIKHSFPYLPSLSTSHLLTSNNARYYYIEPHSFSSIALLTNFTFLPHTSSNSSFSRSWSCVIIATRLKFWPGRVAGQRGRWWWWCQG